MNIKKILVPVDDSTFALKTAEAACQLAHTLQATVCMLHVVDPAILAIGAETVVYPITEVGALLEGDRAALDLEILDQRHAVAALQHVAAGILDDALAIFVAAFRNCLRPFETAVGADVVVAIRVSVFKRALRAGGDAGHTVSLC